MTAVADSSHAVQRTGGVAEAGLGDQALSRATREPGAAWVIDRYLLRTLNLQSLRGREAGSQDCVVIDFAGCRAA
jgi:hypothetical protein